MLVYLATNTLNGKRYVGVTRRTLAARMSEHKSRASYGSRTAFAGAIRKHGWQAFKWETLEVCDNMEALKDAEARYIATLETRVEGGKGYNRTDGRDGSVRVEVSQATRQKLSAAAKGRAQSALSRLRKSAALKGRPANPKAFQALASALSDPERNAAWRARISASRTGMKIGVSSKALAGYAKAVMTRRAKQSCTKLVREMIPAIAEKRKAGESFRVIGNEYGVNPVTVFYFCRRHGIAA